MGSVRSPGRCECFQYWRRSWGHGGSDRDDDRDPILLLDAHLRSPNYFALVLFFIPPDSASPEMANACFIRLCDRGIHVPSRLDRCFESDLYTANRIFGHVFGNLRRNTRHDDLALSIFLASITGSGGRPSGRKNNDQAARRYNRQGIARSSNGRSCRNVFLEPGHVFYYSDNRRDLTRQWKNRHRDSTASG